jgi:hypothetical protein
LEDALSKGRPKLFNTDQGRSPVTRNDFTDVLRARGFAISVDGRGRRDNIFLERLRT